MNETTGSGKVVEMIDIRSSRRRRWVVATVAAIGAIVGLSAWWSTDRPSDEAIRMPEAVGSESAGPAVSVAALAPISDAALPRGDSVSKEGEVEVCGGGWLSLEGDAAAISARREALLTAKQDEVTAQLLPVMRSSADETVRAAALAIVALPGVTVNRIADACHDGPNCDALRADARDAAVSRDALADLASRSSNPQVYAWAAQACRSLSSRDVGGSCQLINADQLARLDPDNAASWELVAFEAQARHDDAALDAAMYRFGSSSRYDVGWGRLAATLVDNLPAGQASLVGGLGVSTTATALDAVMLPPSPAVILKYCSAARLADSNRREVCIHVADTMLNHSTTLFGLSMGRTLVKRLEGDSPRAHALAQWEMAAVEVSTPPAVAPSELGCKAVEAEFERIRRVASVGEVELARRAIASRGLPLASLAAEARERSSRQAQRLAEDSNLAAAEPAAASGAGTEMTR